MIFSITGLLKELTNIIKSKLNPEEIARLMRESSKDGNYEINRAIDAAGLEALKNFKGMTDEEIVGFVKMSTGEGSVENWQIVADCIAWNKPNAKEIFRLAKITTKASIDEFRGSNISKVCSAAINSGRLSARKIVELVELSGGESTVFGTAEKSGKLDVKTITKLRERYVKKWRDQTEESAKSHCNWP